MPIDLIVQCQITPVHSTTAAFKSIPQICPRWVSFNYVPHSNCIYIDSFTSCYERWWESPFCFMTEYSLPSLCKHSFYSLRIRAEFTESRSCAVEVASTDMCNWKGEVFFVEFPLQNIYWITNLQEKKNKSSSLNWPLAVLAALLRVWGDTSLRMAVGPIHVAAVRKSGLLC